MEFLLWSGVVRPENFRELLAPSSFPRSKSQFQTTLDDFVYSFDSPICLRMSRGRVEATNIELGERLSVIWDS